MDEQGPKQQETPRERFTDAFGKLQDEERAKGERANPDLVGIDRMDLTEADIAMFLRLQEGTLSLEEFEAARRSLPELGTVPAEDGHTLNSRKRFYAYLGNMLNIVEGRKTLARMRAARQNQNV